MHTRLLSLFVTSVNADLDIKANFLSAAGGYETCFCVANTHQVYKSPVDAAASLLVGVIII